MGKLPADQPIASRVCPNCSCEEPLCSTSKAWPQNWQCSHCRYKTQHDGDIVLTAPELADTQYGIDPANFPVLYQTERTHFWFVVRRELILALANKYAPTARNYLEIGCGSGSVLSALAETRSWDRIVGTEIHPKGLILAKTRIDDRVELVQADARYLPFRNCFDFVGAFDVLEHIVEDDIVLGAVHDALISGGWLIVTVPQHPQLWSSIDEAAFHVRRYRRDELENKLVAAKFDIVFSTSFATVLLPLIWLSRVMARRFNREAGLAAGKREFAISPIVNTLLAKILRREIALTKRGVRWPLGGSRVVVARKSP